MKTKKRKKNQTNSRRIKKISPQKHITELQEKIQLRRSDMKLLIAFAIGEKTLPKRYLSAPKFWERTEEDDKRLLNSLRQLRKQIHGWEQELAMLQEDNV